MASDGISGANLWFENWKQTVQLQIEAAKAAAEIMVKQAETNILLAQGAQEWQKVARMHLVLKQLRGAYLQLNTFTTRMRSKIADIERHHDNLRYVRNGENVATIWAQRVWASFRVLERYLPFEQLKAIQEHVYDSAWNEGSNYVDVSDKKKKCASADSDVTNLHLLLIWLDNQQVYMPKRGGAAFMPICWALNAVADAAIPEKKALEDELQGKTAAVYEAWDPAVFAGLTQPKPPTPAPVPSGGG